MGLPSVLMKISTFFAINFLQKLVFFFMIVFIAALTRLGLLKQPEQDSTGEDETTNYVLLIDRRCPIPVPVSVDFLIALIKKKLVVKKFSSRIGGNGADEECICPVCLDSFKNTDEIRDLCNCDHIFHKECLDTWLDQGCITCPLCRSMLFPDNLLIAERKTLLAAADAINT
ncbi:brassinosteroid-responsive RING protein 1-like [Euphorbia lathyris]|uniref:brassinosteroid-responsive RING protein 1-like n=1 Tax=Euphorbia lathyris TaxID=212925 RepID=UPI00331368F9